MRNSTLSLGALLLATATATPAFAQDAAAPTAPPPAITVTGGATVVSDYRFRGISQTDKKVALQGTFTITHESGVYASVWGSSIDDYVAYGSDQEIDLVAGYSHTFANGVKLDGGVLYYYYPGGGHNKTDFVEPYIDVSATMGPVTGKLTANYAPKQSALDLGSGKEDNLYIAGDLSSAIPKTPFSVTAHLGHSFGPSVLSLGYKNYTDWGLGVSYTWNHVTLGANYVDTNRDTFIIDGPGKLRNITSGGFVGSIGVSF